MKQTSPLIKRAEEKKHSSRFSSVVVFKKHFSFRILIVRCARRPLFLVCWAHCEVVWQSEVLVVIVAAFVCEDPAHLPEL